MWFALSIYDYYKQFFFLRQPFWRVTEGNEETALLLRPAFIVGFAARPHFGRVDGVEEQSGLEGDLREVRTEAADGVVARERLERQDAPVAEVRDVDEDPERPIFRVFADVEDLRDEADDEVDGVKNLVGNGKANSWQISAAYYF